MKLSKSNTTLIIIIIIGIVLLALQIPFTNSLTENNATTLNKEVENYTVTKINYLPSILNEVSGIAWLNKDYFACVQDEDGTLFIYYTTEKKITHQIKFASDGDYEELAVNDKDAYVMRSDGVLFEIKDFASNDRVVSKFNTLFSSKNNVESLTFDKANNQLITIPKSKDLGDKRFKSIYKIPLATKAMDKTPIIKIDLEDKKFEPFYKNKIFKTFSPSDLAIHPITGEIYVLDGRDPKLLILSSKGVILKIYKLNKKTFSQPEGITFSASGTLFISNEANGGSANILEVKLN
ncbi:SdiA-regulated domain-containing protein [Lacinutrix chionoecetis]